jgi:hypothetical protein
MHAKKVLFIIIELEQSVMTTDMAQWTELSCIAQEVAGSIPAQQILECMNMPVYSGQFCVISMYNMYVRVFTKKG